MGLYEYPIPPGGFKDVPPAVNFTKVREVLHRDWSLFRPLTAADYENQPRLREMEAHRGPLVITTHAETGRAVVVPAAGGYATLLDGPDQRGVRLPAELIAEWSVS